MSAAAFFAVGLAMILLILEAGLRSLGCAIARIAGGLSKLADKVEACSWSLTRSAKKLNRPKFTAEIIDL
jgi:hypothetical protein